MFPQLLADRLTACLLVLLTVLVAIVEWGGTLPPMLVPLDVLAVLALLGLRVRPGRLAFLAIGVLLTVLLALSGQDWFAIARKGLGSAAFIAAFFTALSTLRNVAETSPAIRAGGTFLALQPRGRRYAALSVRGHLFALLLNYGAISLLGSLASTSAAAEADPEIRRHRMRRMLLAIQRGFIASLPWSPLAFAMAVTTALIPGARWSDAALPGLVSAMIVLVTGWALDRIFKPRLTGPTPPSRPVEGSWALMTPLLVLLMLMALSVGALHSLSGVRVVGIVMVVVPLISLGWAAIQHAGGDLDTTPAARVADYLGRDLPGYRGEVTLLMMAGYIGTVGAPLLGPVVAGSGFHPEELPPYALGEMDFWWFNAEKAEALKASGALR